MKAVCFTGHRDLHGREPQIYERLYMMLESCVGCGYREFRTGGAIGFDTLAARVVLALREQYPDVRLVIYVPCRDQARRWLPAQQQQYLEHLAAADEVKVLSEHYYRGCMFVRNRALVDGSELCIAYLKESGGGTKWTVDYANKQNVTVINIGELI